MNMLKAAIHNQGFRLFEDNLVMFLPKQIHTQFWVDARCYGVLVIIQLPGRTEVACRDTCSFIYDVLIWFSASVLLYFHDGAHFILALLNISQLLIIKKLILQRHNLGFVLHFVSFPAVANGNSKIVSVIQLIVKIRNSIDSFSVGEMMCALAIWFRFFSEYRIKSLHLAIVDL